MQDQDEGSSINSSFSPSSISHDLGVQIFQKIFMFSSHQDLGTQGAGWNFGRWCFYGAKCTHRLILIYCMLLQLGSLEFCLGQVEGQNCRNLAGGTDSHMLLTWGLQSELCAELEGPQSVFLSRLTFADIALCNNPLIFLLLTNTAFLWGDFPGSAKEENLSVIGQFVDIINIVKVVLLALLDPAEELQQVVALPGRPEASCNATHTSA